MALPLPSHTRSAKAAIAACFVLTCGAVLGITTIISHGRNATRYEIATPAPRQGATPAPRQGSAAAPTPDSSPTFRAEAEPDPVRSAAPVGMAPALAEHAASRSITVVPAGERIDQVADDQPGTSPGNVRSGAITAAITAVLPNPTSKQCDPDTATDPVTPDDAARPTGAPKPSDTNTDKPVDAGRPAGADKLAGPGTPSDPGTPTNPAKPAVSSEPAVPAIGEGPSQRAIGHSPADVVHERLAHARELIEHFHARAAAPAR